MTFDSNNLTLLNTDREIFQAFLDGKGVICKTWGQGEFLYMNDAGSVCDEKGNELGSFDCLIGFTVYSCDLVK